MKYAEPPYIARTSNFAAVQFHLSSVDAQKLVPKGIKVKADENGLVTAGLEIYTTDQVFGLPKYTIAFVGVGIVDETVNPARAGNWSVWGIIDNDESLQHFKQNFNFPYTVEKAISISQSGEDYTATAGSDNTAGFSLNLKQNKEKPVSAEGLAPVYSKSAGGEILRTEIPWLANGYQADIVSFKINAGNNQILKILQNAEPFYAQVSSNVFSYPKPLKLIL